MEEQLIKKCIIVGVKLSSNTHFKMEMEELRGLANACNIEVIEECIQQADSFNIKYYLRSGKIEELKQRLDITGADYAIFNDELSGVQLNNLNKKLDVIIYDRTYLILEIFKSRANTKEARLQVEIATLAYMKSRLVGLREGLSRQRGGSSGGGAYGKGRGETQLEIDRRNIDNRIVYLRHELATVVQERKTQRKKRLNSDQKIVALVGYTNAGKSSMLNALLNYSISIKKEVMEKDMLFATLETSSRFIQLKNNHKFILTDTVGFISKLPTTLVDAFKSTLEEIKEADLLIHMVDASNSDFETQINTTNNILKEIGVSNIETIYCFNKIDKCNNEVFIPNDIISFHKTSIKENIGLNELLNHIESLLFSNEIEVKLFIPYEESKHITTLKNECNLLSIEKSDLGYNIRAVIPSSMLNKFAKFKI